MSKILFGTALAAVAIAATSIAVVPRLMAEGVDQEPAAQWQKYYDCGEVDVEAAIDPTKTISMQQDTIDRNNHTAMVAAFWHKQSAKECRPWGQHMGYKNELGTFDVGDWLSAPLAQENIKYIVLVEGDGSRVYSLDELRGMGWNDYQVYIKNMRAGYKQLSDDNVPDGPQYDQRIKDLEAQKISTKPTTPFTEIVDRLALTGGMVQGEWLFENTYPGYQQ